MGTSHFIYKYAKKLGLPAVVCANDINNALIVVKYILLLYCLLKTVVCMYNKFLNFYLMHPMYDMISLSHQNDLKTL